VGWLEIVNQAQSDSEVKEIQLAVCRGHPIGDDVWTEAIAASFQISTAKPGRPKKTPGVISG